MISRVTCPKCHLIQLPASTCKACGARLVSPDRANLPRSFREPRESAKGATPPNRLRLLILIGALGLFLVLLVVLLVPRLSTRDINPPNPEPTSARALTTATKENYSKTARQTAEAYWNSQKISDVQLFKSVTPHEQMKVVFAWTFVNESPISIEEGDIPRIRDDYQEFLRLHQEYRRHADVFGQAEQALAVLKGRDEYRKRIEVAHPMLADFLNRGYWETITPPNFADLRRYKLMRYMMIVDVELQSKGGLTLKKRVDTHLRRLVADDRDSGWKVFYIPGAY